MAIRSQRDNQSSPKLLFVAFDGTWHGSVKSSKETVVSSLPDLISKGEQVRKIRVNGVGTDGLTDKILGGLGGWGTRRNVITAYRNITDDYNKGDRIVFCGYSRGAWAARYLAMIISCLGLVQDGDTEFFKRLYDACKKDPYLTKANKDELRCNYDYHVPNNVKYSFHALALHETRSPYSPTYMCGHNVHQVFFLGDHGNMGKLGQQEGLVHAPLAWMVQQLSSHLDVSFDEDKLKRRFPSYTSEGQAEMISRQGTHDTTHEAMMKHAWCFPSGSIPGAGVGRLVIMGRKDRNPGMVLNYCDADCTDSSTDESTHHETAPPHAQIHIGARGRQECGFSDAVPGYLGVQPMDPNQLFFWKRSAVFEQEVVAADVIQEAKVGFLEARLLGLPAAAASHPDCCGLNRIRQEEVDTEDSAENEATWDSKLNQVLTDRDLGPTDEEDYEEDYEDSDEQSDGEDYDESNEEEAEDSDEESNEESDEENDQENDEESTSFRCQNCDEAFYYTAALGEHQEMFAHGPMAIREKKPEPVEEPPAPEIKCRDCDKAFCHFTMLLEHQQKAGHGSWAAEKNKAVEKPVEKPAIEDKVGNASISVFKCTDCGGLYCDVTPFLDHMGHNHARHPKLPNRYLTKVAPKEADAPFKKITSGFRCKPCNEPFRNQHLLVVHWEKRHEDAWDALFDQDNISDASLSYSDFQNFDNYDEDDMLDDLREISSWSSKKNTIHCMTCWKKFRTTSQMVEHVETCDCHSYINARSIKRATDRSDQSVVSRCYSDNKFQCPGCEARFESLSSLIRHAEGNKCSANVTPGPIKAFMTDVRWRMIEGELF
ncbi:hypothetical protein F25303_5408 [Fusarium sp. NRRL 25303]|nr:hypothetical protein F25303_5408 [Fusarium sp. NRRL 25303]